MDPSLALSPLSSQPPEIGAHAALLGGAFLPVVVPTPWLSAECRARWLLASADAPLALRVSAALDAGMTDAAWAELARRASSPGADPALDLALSRWAAAESARLGLSAGPMIALGVDAGRMQAATHDLRAAHDDVAGLLAPLGWPRWSGATVVVVGAEAHAGLAVGEHAMTRPALPIVRVASGRPLRVAAAGAFCRLALRLCAPPAGGWPPWLEIGLAGIAEAKAAGGDQRPSPMAMLALRQQAGLERIAETLRSATPDPALATAICAPLAHSRRRGLLPNLLDALRNGVESPGALELVYGVTAESLVREK
ncbi:MAG TPA: hypothetical protein VEL07_23675 [Planctomycetota bacterium]|nr:hypothetical protein [Planctomycetota bacterium]